ncbi:uncharacterized protein LOC100568829 [Acyrthosiphon pisum]|uniref:CS domain-containing protein n=1 Tax=Acyrthosiphon pisum TaxID=7029 RepID=A0A8R1W4V6_ACYPI|nr:uncharacterized protein LOC100568829 [Acyrthosiphon pisum]|eukprot:XP_003243458.1 PREDICTED: uncharacterized protein LOC100568829 isoform X1 [Acyrthosiphon pisum]
MSDNVDEPRPAEQSNVNKTQQPANDIDWSQLYDMFMKIEKRLPNFDHMLIAMNDYAFQRTSRQRQTNDLSEFCGVLKKGFFDWYTSSINNEINRVPNFIDLTNKVFDDEILMKFDKKLVSSTSHNADTDKCIKTSASTDASESINTITNANVGESTNTSTSADTSKSTSKNANTCSHKSVNKCSHKNDSTSSHTSASKFTNKRARMSLNTYSEMMAAKTKYYYKHLEITKSFENAEGLEPIPLPSWLSTEQSPEESIEQSTETDVVTNQKFKIIMPKIPEEVISIRRRLPIDCNIHLGMEYERYWWRQTNDKIVLNVDISDLVQLVPNIKVVVSIIGFKIKIKQLNKWIVLISNKFIKPITKSKWVVNKHMHIKLTLDKKEREFWSKCLVTEIKEHDTRLFKNHTCSSVCTAPIIKGEKIPFSTSQKECLKTLREFLKKDYGLEDLDESAEGIANSTETNSPAKEEKPQDSAITLKSSVDPSTVESLNSDSENLQNTKQTSMDPFRN